MYSGASKQRWLTSKLFVLWYSATGCHTQPAACLGVLGSGIPGMDRHIQLLSILPSLLFSLFGAARKTVDQTMPDGLMELCTQSSFLLPVPSRWWKAPEVHI